MKRQADEAARRTNERKYSKLVAPYLDMLDKVLADLREQTDAPIYQQFIVPDYRGDTGSLITVEIPAEAGDASRRFYFQERHQVVAQLFDAIRERILATTALKRAVLEAVRQQVPPQLILDFALAATSFESSGRKFDEVRKQLARAKGGQRRAKLTDPQEITWLKQAFADYADHKNSCRKIAECLTHAHKTPVSEKTVRKRLRELGLREDA